MTPMDQLTNGDKAVIREIAYEVGEVIIQRHAKVCQLERGVKMWKLVATALASGVLGGIFSGGMAAKIVARIVAGM